MASTIGYTKSGLIDLAIDQLLYQARQKSYLGIEYSVALKVRRKLNQFTKQEIADHVEAEVGDVARICEINY